MSTQGFRKDVLDAAYSDNAPEMLQLIDSEAAAQSSGQLYLERDPVGYALRTSVRVPAERCVRAIVEKYAPDLNAEDYYKIFSDGWIQVAHEVHDDPAVAEEFHKVHKRLVVYLIEKGWRMYGLHDSDWHHPVFDYVFARPLVLADPGWRLSIERIVPKSKARYLVRRPRLADFSKRLDADDVQLQGEQQ